MERRLKKLLSNINYRCNYQLANKYKYYGGKGIRCFLSLEDLRLLWHRDGAAKMKQPSIDRIDVTRDYTLKNCQFIEMEENRKKRILVPNRICEKCGTKFWSAWPSVLCSGCRLEQSKRVCKRCKKTIEPQTSRSVCDPCRFISRPCGFCGKTITRDSAIPAGGRILRSNRWFCSRKENLLWRHLTKRVF